MLYNIFGDIMSFLNYFKKNIINRGINYYNSNNVCSSEQLSPYLLKGEVSNNNDIIYDVTINLAKPTSSICSCPYAKKGGLCKHMVALYFDFFPEEVDYYNEDEEYDDYYDDDYYEYDNDDGDYYDDDYTSPVDINDEIYNNLLNEFINELSTIELKNLLKEYLSINKSNTFNKYLKDKYKMLLQNSTNPLIIIEKIKQNLSVFKNKYTDYNYFDDEIVIFSNIDKENITNIYLKHKKYIPMLNTILQQDYLYIYEDYRWLIDIYNNHLSSKEKDTLILRLNNYFTQLKNMGIKNDKIKSNVLCLIYELSSYTVTSLVELMSKNLKYTHFIEYVINHYEDTTDLFNEFKNTKLFKNRYFLEKIYLYFYDKLKNEECLELHYYYDFLLNNNIKAFKNLKESNNFEKYKTKLLNSSKLNIKISVYLELNMVDELYELIINNPTLLSIDKYIPLLKTKYNDELKVFFKNLFYNNLINASKRVEYYNASQYLKYILMLNNGEECVKKIINDLYKNPKYNKRYALFEEIKNTINNIDAY